MYVNPSIAKYVGRKDFECVHVNTWANEEDFMFGNQVAETFDLERFLSTYQDCPRSFYFSAAACHFCRIRQVARNPSSGCVLVVGFACTPTPVHS